MLQPQSQGKSGETWEDNPIGPPVSIDPNMEIKVKAEVPRAAPVLYVYQDLPSMKMEVLHSGISYSNDDKRNLEQLLETFGSMVSLEDIASAYCQAGRDVYMAGEILCKPHRSISSTSTSAFNDELEDGSASSDWSSDNVPGKSYLDNNSTLTRSKMRSASMGVVSGVIAREYAKPRLSTNDAHGTTKPLKLKSSDFPTSVIWGEEGAPDAAVRSETMHKDVEDFLFTMLGDGFRLDINSMEKLLDISAFTLEKSDDVLSIAAQKSIENLQDAESLSSSGKLKHGHTAGSSNASFIARSESGVTKRERDIYNLQKEVLESLFSVPGRVEEAPKRKLPVKEGSRMRFGQAVTKPLIDIPTTRRTVTVTSQVSEDEIEDSFEDLRKAVKEYWVTMKEYYEAAINAFAEGDQARAYKLLGEGQFFMNKAREADEKSAQKLLEARNDEDVMSLDLLDHGPREALRLVKFHLTSLCGIPSISYLKLIVGSNDNDTKEEARKRLASNSFMNDIMDPDSEATGEALNKVDRGREWPDYDDAKNSGHKTFLAEKIYTGEEDEVQAREQGKKREHQIISQDIASSKPLLLNIILALRTDVAIRIRRTMAIDDRMATIITTVMRTAAARI
ncbi:hypothetical protein RJ639_006633 [Escallonia herrerae]|uniref:DUF1771 domain-containing protein n=1 Tax=Escallonia herrerae TaxID=1293975 RepID=A0AA89AZY6_9ASTE|nr:hypothetical protein RJ639_006633 [Escallonia herrerae]